MNMPKEVEQLIANMTRWTITAWAWEIAGTIILFFALYWVVKAAVRDGINESRLGERPSRAAKGLHKDSPDLPDMRAER